jgi:hypothetical protein
MDANDARDPASGTAGRGDAYHPFEKCRRIQLKPTPLPRLHGAKHIGLGQPVLSALAPLNNANGFVALMFKRLP